jgi:UDPglucose--hexose-1-phosphate uridylyltransferase
MTEGQSMEFSKVVITTELRRPPSFERDIQHIEYREDPLTHVPCRINMGRASRPKQTPAGGHWEAPTGGEDDCPFCPGNIERATPVFASSFCADKRIRKGECYLFPNLYPLAEYHATGTLTVRHALDLGQFQADMVQDSLMAAREYLLWVHKRCGESKYPIYVWNHLPPSAASVVHPHVQVLVDRRPTPYQQRLLQSSKEYLLGTGRDYWQDIVEEERRREERYIGRRGSVVAIASYAPQGNREVQMIFSETSNLMDLGEGEATDFADCVVRVLRGYKRMGMNSFNLSTFSAPLGEKLGHYRLHAKLISRPVCQPFYRNDSGILERFHYEADIEIRPETFAQGMRELFAG